MIHFMLNPWSRNIKSYGQQNSNFTKTELKHSNGFALEMEMLLKLLFHCIKIKSKKTKMSAATMWFSETDY